MATKNFIMAMNPVYFNDDLPDFEPKILEFSIFCRKYSESYEKPRRFNENILNIFSLTAQQRQTSPR
jgi:hypothetical protein